MARLKDIRLGESLGGQRVLAQWMEIRRVRAGNSDNHALERRSQTEAPGFPRRGLQQCSSGFDLTHR